MGEKDVDVKQDASEKKIEDGVGNNKKADEGPITVVLKLDLHCAGCAKKVKKSVLYIEGVESVKADSANNKLTITGKVDPGYLKERVEFKTKKTVEIISPKPKIDDGGAKKEDEKPTEAKSNNQKPKEPQSTTVVLKIPLHCDGCSQKIKRIISKIDGVESVKPDSNKNLVTVKGTMNMKNHIPYLKDKLRRNVDIVPPKQEEEKSAVDQKTDTKKVAEEGGTDVKNDTKEDDTKKNTTEKPKDGSSTKEDEKKKEQEPKTTANESEKKKADDEVKTTTGGGGGGGSEGEVKTTTGGGSGDSKEKAGATSGGGGEEGKRMDVMNKFEYYRHDPYVYTMPMYNERYHNQDYGVSVSYTSQGYVNEGYGNYQQGYVNMGYYPYRAPLPPSPMSLHNPRALESDMLSLENPNACEIM